MRAAGGCTDSDNNSTDFATGAPNPRNTSSPIVACSAPPTSTPTPISTPTAEKLLITDTLSVPNLAKYTAGAIGSLALANTGDEVLLLGPGDQIVDSVAWGNGDFTAVGLRGHASASEPQSLQRYGTQDTDNMSLGFLHGQPSPGVRVMPPVPRPPRPPAPMPNGMFAYWGDLHAHSTVSDGSGPPRMAFATARTASLRLKI